MAFKKSDLRNNILSKKIETAHIGPHRIEAVPDAEHLLILYKTGGKRK